MPVADHLRAAVRRFPDGQHAGGNEAHDRTFGLSRLRSGSRRRLVGRFRRGLLRRHRRGFGRGFRGGLFRGFGRGLFRRFGGGLLRRLRGGFLRGFGGGFLRRLRGGFLSRLSRHLRGGLSGRFRRGDRILHFYILRQHEALDIRSGQLHEVILALLIEDIHRLACRALAQQGAVLRGLLPDGSHVGEDRSQEGVVRLIIEGLAAGIGEIHKGIRRIGGLRRGLLRGLRSGFLGRLRRRLLRRFRRGFLRRLRRGFLRRLRRGLLGGFRRRLLRRLRRRLLRGLRRRLLGGLRRRRRRCGDRFLRIRLDILRQHIPLDLFYAGQLYKVILFQLIEDVDRITQDTLRQQSAVR